MMHIRKERYSRRHAGKHVVWLVADKYQQYLLVSQKLNWVKDFIDKNLASAPCDTVSISGLYSCAGSKDGRHGGFHKHRWAVVCAPLEDARDAIESVRPRTGSRMRWCSGLTRAMRCSKCVRKKRARSDFC